MKRLKNIFLAMQNETSTYKGMYEGRMLTADLSSDREPILEYDSTYWRGDFACTISETHKLVPDKPTILWQIPALYLGIDEGSAVAADYCLRRFAPYIDELNAALYNRSRPDKENGKFYLYRPGGKVLVRNAAYFDTCLQKDYENGSGMKVYLLNDDMERPPRLCLCIRMQVQLPRKRLRRTIQMLCRDLPDAIERFVAEFDMAGLQNAIALSEKQRAIRAWLADSEYCAFLANGSILPRESKSDRPMTDAIRFKSTAEDEIEVCGVRGMGIKRGVTVITGGGYSGKSTVLDAISAGIYDHFIGDGRELCLTDESAMTISAEDGRSVKSVNISPFIKWLPKGDTRCFSTDHASGSTSQAANIMEAVSYGARLLLIDEDRSATNFMIRDAMMKELIEKEPITPFTDRVGELHKKGVSTILVIGGSGEYLSVADATYRMDDFIISNVTESAGEICQRYGIRFEAPPPAAWHQSRTLYAEGFTSYPEGSGSEKLVVSDMGFILIGNEQIDIRGLHDIVSRAQADAIGFMLRLLMVQNASAIIELDKRVDELYEKIEQEGLDSVYSRFFTTGKRFLELPRRSELKAAVNRMKHICMKAGEWSE